MESEVATRERPIIFSGPMVRAIREGRKTQTRRVIKPQKIRVTKSPAGPDLVWLGDTTNRLSCPYAPGMTLWVCETVQYTGPWNIPNEGRLWYPADGKKPFDEAVQTKSGEFMPRWASRLTLEVTDVRVQRVQDISEEDARAEGCGVGCRKIGCDCARNKFHELWDSINAKRGFGWDANPAVRAVTFKRIDGGR